MSYTILGNPTSRTFRVIWAMEEMGLPYQLQACSPHSEAINKHSPLGKIPALLDGDTAISDSLAIIQYLADKHQQLTFPAGTLSRAKQDSYTYFVADEIDSAWWTFYKNAKLLADDYRHDAIEKFARFEFNKAIQNLEKILSANAYHKGQYLMGETFTVADVFLGYDYTFLERTGLSLPATGVVRDYFESCAARPAFQKTSGIVAEFLAGNP